jgi:putative salt-induced outer membrane protein YdiY
MKFKITTILIITIIFVAYISNVSADEIRLVNGDKLTGSVIKMENETITFATEYSPSIEIQRSKIMKITTDSPVNVHLKNGEVLKGELNTSPDGLLMVAPSGGRTEVSVEWPDISSFNPPPVTSSWKGNVNLSSGLQSGNTDRSSVSFGADALKRTEKERFSLQLLYNYAEEDNNETASNTYAAVKYDHFFNKKTFGYLSIEMLNDKFKNLNLRTVFGPGVGYQIWDTKAKSLSVEGGVSYFSEDLKEGEDDQWATARLAGDFTYNINDRVTFLDHLILYPSIEDAGEYTLRNEAVLASVLEGDWSMRFSNIFERDSEPSAGIEKDDWQWLLGLQYDFDI